MHIESYLREETYKKDLLEFTGKSLSYWKERRLFYFNKYGNDFQDHATIENKDFSHISHNLLIELYNHEAWHALYYTEDNFRRLNISESLEHPVFKIFKDYLHNERKIVLDHGCNCCKNSWIFLRQGYKVLSVDLPLDYIKFLDWRIRKYNVSDIEFLFVEQSTEYLKDYIVDAIYSNDVFEHCINPHRVLAYLSDHLRIGGIFFVEVVFSDSKYHLRRNYELFTLEHDGKEKFYGNLRWQECIKNAGLEKIESYKKEKDANVMYIKKQEVDFSKFDFE